MTHRPIPVWIWAVLALAFAVLGQGRFAVVPSPAVWLMPVFLVRFVREAPRGLALAGFVAIHTLAMELAFLGMVPLPTPARIGMFAGLSLILGLVFLADRWIARRFDSFLTTLVLPCGWVTYDFLTGLFGPNGTWGSIAYGLVPQRPFAQLASITGWTGLTFLVSWFATVVNWTWEARLAGRRVGRGLAIAGTAFGLVLAFGLLRPALHEASPLARVALLAAPDTFRGEHLDEVWAYTRGIDIDEEQLRNARAQMARWQDRHFALLDEALAGDVRLAAWAEVNAAVTEAEEPGWIERARAAARAHAAYVGLGLAVFRPQSGQRTQNRFVLLGPDGETVWDLLKATRVPGSHHVVGDGVLPQADTELGRLTAAICFDLDFPRLLRQAGWMDADVLIAPSNDWTEVRHIHADMATLRAIEQGFHLVRPTKDGIATVRDTFGRVLAQRDTHIEGEHVLLAEVPTRGVVTVYSRIGDTFAWLACGVFASGLLFGRRATKSSDGRSTERGGRSMRRATPSGFTTLLLIAALAAAGPTARAEDLPPGPLDDGIAHFEAGNDAAAESALREHLVASPEDPRAAHYLGRIHFQRRQTDEAIEWLKRAAERDGSSSDYQLWLGRAYLQKLQSASMFKKMGLSKKVRAHYAKAIELDPDNLSARESLAGYHFEAPGIAGGSTAKGLEQVREIQARDPRRGHFAMASHHMRKKKYDLAEREYRAALAIAPDDPDALYRLGNLFSARGDYDQAFAQFEKALANDAGHMESLYAVGRTAALSGRRLERGAACLVRYLEGRPERGLPAPTWAHWRLGMVYEHQGDVAGARRSYRSALAADPDNDDARKALEKLGAPPAG